MGTVVRDLLFKAANVCAAREPRPCITLTEKYMPDNSLEGWKNTTWVWDK
jgi:hypothetical protein